MGCLTNRTFRELTNLKFSVFKHDDTLITNDLYVKVTEQLSNSPPAFRVNFTFIPPEAESFFATILNR